MSYRNTEGTAKPSTDSQLLPEQKYDNETRDALMAMKANIPEMLCHAMLSTLTHFSEQGNPQILFTERTKTKRATKRLVGAARFFTCLTSFVVHICT